MTARKPDTFKIIQSYGGVKEALFTVEDVTAADTIDFSDNNLVASDIQFAHAQESDGSFVELNVCATDETVTVGSGPSAELIKGKINFREY